MLLREVRNGQRCPCESNFKDSDAAIDEADRQLYLAAMLSEYGIKLGFSAKTLESPNGIFVAHTLKLIGELVSEVHAELEEHLIAVLSVRL